MRSRTCSLVTVPRSPRATSSTDETGELVFAGHDASRALGMSSLKPEDVRPDWTDLPAQERKTLDDWMIFFSKRYNIVGVIEGATNMDREAADEEGAEQLTA